MSSRIVPKPKNAKFAANKLRRAIMAVVRTTAAAKAPNFFFKEMESHQERMLSLAGFIEWKIGLYILREDDWRLNRRENERLSSEEDRKNLDK